MRPAPEGKRFKPDAPVKRRLLIDPVDRRGLLERLRHRKVVQWTVGYLAGAFIVLQLMDVLSEVWAWPLVFQQGVSLGTAVGLLPALVIAWYHGEKGRQHVCRAEAILLLSLVVFGAAVVWRVCCGGF